ncbi:hypothetical protein OG978_32725 [Streptomyces sp. NBC_01591]|uniref:hypothetical protein n=1 Tax=Streptomyces sp. NBC_01591 TaxID=2975888 RepID=UPI002DDC751C|nr:hypothetical protein [Streptomyces sp. NBC_01591]WSD71739.1 hypothetical protein OG978_32725 [Streptomyces sp. NBC_01591]
MADHNLSLTQALVALPEVEMTETRLPNGWLSITFADTPDDDRLRGGGTLLIPPELANIPA